MKLNISANPISGSIFFLKYPTSQEGINHLITKVETLFEYHYVCKIKATITNIITDLHYHSKKEFKENSPEIYDYIEYMVVNQHTNDFVTYKNYKRKEKIKKLLDVIDE